MCETGFVNSEEAHANITLKLLEEALWSDKWRGFVRREITKHTPTHKETFLKARRTASWRTTLDGASSVSKKCSRFSIVKDQI